MIKRRGYLIGEGRRQFNVTNNLQLSKCVLPPKIDERR